MERDKLIEEAKAKTGEVEFSVGGGLRLTWVAAQRADKELRSFFSKSAAGNFPAGYRLASDGLLERQVAQPPPIGEAWVPVVPDGLATAHVTWRKWLLLQTHIGVLGAHRNHEETLNILSSQVWWRGMKDDVKAWCEKCLTCLRFRKMPMKTHQVAVIPTDAE